MSIPEFSVGDLVAGWQNYEMNGLIIEVSEYVVEFTYEDPVICYHVYWPNGYISWYMHDELILIQENRPTEE